MEIERAEDNEVRVAPSPIIFLEDTSNRKPACWGCGYCAGRAAGRWFLPPRQNVSGARLSAVVGKV